MSEKSPTPWYISEGVIVSSDGHWIAQMELTGGEDVDGEILQNANAAHIVEAVNSYATLRAELNAVRAEKDRIANEIVAEEMEAIQSTGESTLPKRFIDFMAWVFVEIQEHNRELAAVTKQRDELLAAALKTADKQLKKAKRKEATG